MTKYSSSPKLVLVCSQRRQWIVVQSHHVVEWSEVSTCSVYLGARCKVLDHSTGSAGPTLVMMPRYSSFIQFSSPMTSLGQPGKRHRTFARLGSAVAGIDAMIDIIGWVLHEVGCSDARKLHKECLVFWLDDQRIVYLVCVQVYFLK